MAPPNDAEHMLTILLFFNRRADGARPVHSIRSVRAQFGHTACMGLSLSRGRHAILVVLCIPFFCSTRPASTLPSRPHIAIAVARSGGPGTAFFHAAGSLFLTDPGHAARRPAFGGWVRR